MRSVEADNPARSVTATPMLSLPSVQGAPAANGLKSATPLKSRTWPAKGPVWKRQMVVLLGAGASP